jgi:hypothetical protein
MDGSPIDTLSRAIAAGSSRRSLAWLLGGMALSIPLLLGGSTGTAAKHKHHRKHKKHKPCQGLQANGSACTQSSECCSGNCFNALCADRVTTCAGTPCTPPANGCAGTTCCGAPAFFPCGNFCCAPPSTACCGSFCCA